MNCSISDRRKILRCSSDAPRDFHAHSTSGVAAANRSRSRRSPTRIHSATADSTNGPIVSQYGRAKIGTYAGVMHSGSSQCRPRRWLSPRSVRTAAHVGVVAQRFHQSPPTGRHRGVRDAWHHGRQRRRGMGAESTTKPERSDEQIRKLSAHVSLGAAIFAAPERHSCSRSRRR